MTLTDLCSFVLVVFKPDKGTTELSECSERTDPEPGLRIFPGPASHLTFTHPPTSPLPPPPLPPPHTCLTDIYFREQTKGQLSAPHLGQMEIDAEQDGEQFHPGLDAAVQNLYLVQNQLQKKYFTSN